MFAPRITPLLYIEYVIGEHVTCAFVNIADGEIYSNNRVKDIIFFRALFNNNMTKCPIKYKVAICGRTEYIINKSFIFYEQLCRNGCRKRDLLTPPRIVYLLSVCLSCLSICLVCLSVCLVSVCLCVCLSQCLCVCVSLSRLNFAAKNNTNF